MNPGAATAASAYRPRDVVNAPDIKQRIRERSAARGGAGLIVLTDERMGEVGKRDIIETDNSEVGSPTMQFHH